MKTKNKKTKSDPKEIRNHKSEIINPNKTNLLTQNKTAPVCML